MTLRWPYHDLGVELLCSRPQTVSPRVYLGWASLALIEVLAIGPNMFFYYPLPETECIWQILRLRIIIEWGETRKHLVSGKIKKMLALHELLTYSFVSYSDK